MENVTDALIMAGSVLIFIIALTVSISSFTTLRVGIEQTVGQTETIEMAKDTEGYINYIDSKDANAIRVVGAETVVSSMSRSIKENYVIYIKLTNALSASELRTMRYVKTCNAGKNLTDNSGANLITQGDQLIKITLGPNATSNPRAALDDDKLYDKIKDKKFYEYLGEYQDNTDVNSVEKLTHRIITYIEYV